MKTQSTKKKRVLVAMSGGVDSSVAAALLLDQGYEVIGVTMQVWDYSDSDCEAGFGTCCSSLDVEDARAVAQILNIPFYVINCENEFKNRVIDPFLDSYKKGETPIPCLNCNTYLKFDYLIKKMKELDCQYLATGHYAQIQKKSQWMICQSSDNWKDQTYFLFTIPQELLPKILFPVGKMEKSQIRQIALDKKLPVFNKKDSTGLCFIGKSGYVKFIEDQEDLKTKGSLKLYPSGEKIGEHTGIHQFTYGQRKRLGISYHHPLYVVKIDPQTQTVWLGEESALYNNSIEIKDCHWLDSIKDGERLKVKIRFQHKGSMARIFKKNNDSAHIHFEEPQRAPTPGQSAVLYRNQQLLGGGRIHSLLNP